MAQQTAWGWKKVVLAIVGVAAAMVLLLVATAAVGLVWATSTAERLGEPVPEPVASTVATRDAGVRAAAAANAEQPLRVEIELEEGEFEVRPGPPGTGVQVDGAYAKAYYELTEEHTPAGEPGGPATVIRLRPAHSFLVRLIGSALGGHDGAHNALTVTIPREIPIDLRLRLRMGETRTDLGGVDPDRPGRRSHHGRAPPRLQPAACRAAAPHPRGRRDGRSPTRALRETRVPGSWTWRGAWAASPSIWAVTGRLVPKPTCGWTVRWASSGWTFRTPFASRRDSAVSNVFGATSQPRAGNDASADAPLVRLHLTNAMGETRVRRY